MANSCRYYKQRRYVSYDNGSTWQPLNEYRKGELYEADSTSCGYSPIYRWVDVPSGYTCSGCTKFQKTQKYVSYDGVNWTAVYPYEYGIGSIIEEGSADCECSTQYRWYTLPTTEYICSGTTKYYKQVYQMSYDGVNWENVVPEQYRPSGIIEESSYDCGYGGSITRWVEGWLCDDCVTYKVKSITSAGTEINVECSSSTTVEMSDITSRTAISSSTIGSCATVIGNGAYSGCTNLLNVRIPSTIKSIGNRAFNGCSLLLDASIPDSVQTIGDYAFSGCTQLSYINLSNNLISLGRFAFANSLNFSSINIPLSLSNIPDGCFQRCYGLSNIELHSKIVSIGGGAFQYCDNLYSLTIYALTPPSLGGNAFVASDPYSGLKKIFVPQSAVDAYKTASGWSAYAHIIFPIITT